MIESIEVENYGSVRAAVVLEMGRITLIQGQNDSGKSMLLHAIMLGLSPVGPVPSLFVRDRSNTVTTKFVFQQALAGRVEVIRSFKMDPVQPHFESSRLWINGREFHDASVLRSLVQPTYLSAYGDFESAHRSEITNDSFFVMASKLLGYNGHVDTNVLTHVAGVFDQINLRSSRFFRKIWIDDGVVRLHHRHNDDKFSIYSAGGGDKVNLMTDFAIEVAAMRGSFCTSLLLLDDFPTKVGTRFADRYRDLALPGIQIVTTSHRRQDVQDGLAPDVTHLLACHPSSAGSAGTQVESTIRRTAPEVLQLENAIRSFGSGREDEFTESVVLPLLRGLGFQNPRQTPHHGPGELGFDIGLTKRAVVPGRVAYFGFQVKAGVVNARSNQSGNVTELISQVKKMLATRVVEPESMARVSVDFTVAVVSGHLNAEAKQIWDSEFEGNRRVLLWDAPALAELAFGSGIWPTLSLRRST